METLCRAGTYGECGAASTGEGREEEGVCVSAYGEPLILQPTRYVVGRPTSIPCYEEKGLRTAGSESI